jgi:hypothetical protein
MNSASIQRQERGLMTPMQRLRSHPRLLSLAGAALLLTLSSCTKERPKHRYEFLVRVESDPGRTLAGATVLHGESRVGVSNKDGIVKLSARGKEGDTLSFRIDCPKGHKSPTKPLSVVLRKTSEREKRPEYSVSCLPTMRTVVVAVRAEDGPNLPVRYLDREVGRTDKSGAAHVLLKAAPNEALELTLDTSKAPLLSPKNPTARFQTSHQDEVFVFNQPFTVEKPKVQRARRKPRPTGPIAM